MKLINSSYTPRLPLTVINWGTSAQKVPDRLYQNTNVTWINHPDKVAISSNKLLSFQALKEAGVSIPGFTTNRNEANDWRCIFFGRKVLTASSGNGIIEFDPEYPHSEGGMYPAPSNDNPYTNDACPLYVKYIKKSAEYRIHVAAQQENGQKTHKVIDIQQKRKRRELSNEEVDYTIRSHANGWVFCREDITSPDDSVISEAIAAVIALGLDFGAVDVIWNTHYQKAYVLEVNTAPGLEGTTLQIYTDAILRVIGDTNA